MCHGRLGWGKLVCVIPNCINIIVFGPLFCFMASHLVFVFIVCTTLQGFRSKNLEESESKCVNQCAEKFMKLTQRVGFRFSEYQTIQGQQQAAKK